MRKKFVVQGIYPPALITLLNGQRCVITGSSYTNVNEDTTLDDLIWMKSEKQIKRAQMIKEEKKDDAVYEVDGSKGNKYKVSTKNGLWNCQCVGFSFRRKCKHITEIKAKSITL